MLNLLTIFFKKYQTSYNALKHGKNTSLFFIKKNNFRFIVTYLCIFYKNQYGIFSINNVFKKTIISKIEAITSFKKQNVVKLF